jgi:hypothetical protein
MRLALGIMGFTVLYTVSLHYMKGSRQVNLLSKHSLLLICAVVLSACQVAPRPDTPEDIPEDTPESTEPAPLPAPAPECVCPAPPPPKVITQPCPKPSPPPVATVTAPGGKYIFGRVENVFLPLGDGSDVMLKLKSRIDTGAGLTSMHAEDLKEFERDGKTWVRFSVPQPKTDEAVYFERPVNHYVAIKQPDGETQRRPVVSMSLKVGAIEEFMDVNLADRSEYVYQILIGRNFLRDRAVVDVSRRFIADDEFYFVP